MAETLRGWTDYPIVEFGDIPGKEARVREAIATHYDKDKYITIIVDGITIEIKDGYFYKSPGRCGQVEVFSRKELATLPEQRNG